MRVAHVSLQLETGGMEKLLVEFARHADRSRFALHFVSLGTRGPVADELEALGWPVEALNEPAGFRPGLVWRLACVFRRRSIDLVHAHNSKPLMYCAPAARLGRIGALVCTRHGQRHGATWRQNVLYRATAKLADAVVCVSRDSAARAARDGVCSSRLCTIWNGIDVGRFRYAGPMPGGPVVMVGRLSPEKDVETLLRATRLAISLEPSFRLEVAGTGPCLTSLQRTAAELGLGAAVRFLGRVDDVPGLLARASMSVLSSITEGISLTLLEAMSRGLPVVATDVGGNPEVVLAGETGLLVPPGNPESLAQAMLRVWRDRGSAVRMGLAGRRRAAEHFDVRTMVGNYERLYWRTAATATARRSRGPAVVCGAA